MSIKERGWNILEVTSNLGTIRSIGIGFSKKTIQSLQGYGYNVIPEFRYQTHTTQDLLHYKFQRLAKLDDIKTISFTGQTILGYPNHTSEIIKELQNYTVVMPEYHRPSGLIDIAEAHPNTMLRTYINQSQPLSKAEFPEIHRAIQDRQNTIIVLNLLV